ncbi:rhodanese-related sulfurtransferase [Haloferula luteola]|uniref:Rhodanese-related sulfurtransferase n=1 Tax=Haloferula luteola TaxID=595692 RepID=A0A840V9V2_9BACT|nr:rhodanese-like domain-containing protein [Haloferula luteola]MBB5350559.1 rhodanese-related sulfurtransferase [Haloferula luteola]
MALPDPSQTLEVTPQEVSALAASVAAGEVVLIDCREQDEWEIAHLPGARLLPLSQFAELATPVLEEPKPSIVYCHHGMRSLRATQYLRSRGLENCWSMAGGIDRWSTEIDASVTRY